MYSQMFSSLCYYTLDHFVQQYRSPSSPGVNSEIKYLVAEKKNTKKIPSKE